MYKEGGKYLILLSALFAGLPRVYPMADLYSYIDLFYHIVDCELYLLNNKLLEQVGPRSSH